MSTICTGSFLDRIPFQRDGRSPSELARLQIRRSPQRGHRPTSGAYALHDPEHRRKPIEETRMAEKRTDAGTRQHSGEMTRHELEVTMPAPPEQVTRGRRIEIA